MRTAVNCGRDQQLLGTGAGNIPSSFCMGGFTRLNMAFIVWMLAVPGSPVCWIVINAVHTHVSELFWQVYMLFITCRTHRGWKTTLARNMGQADPARWSFYLSFPHWIIFEQVYWLWPRIGVSPKTRSRHRVFVRL